MGNKNKKIVIGISGASGAIYAKVLLDELCVLPNLEIACVMSKNAKEVWQWEIGNKSYEKYKVNFFESNDFMAPFASGSSNYDAMIICPCSMGTLGRIANGISDSLLTRSADVMLKEKRKLICVVRETPFNLIHISNMQIVAQAGGIIMPATPSFYSKPQTIDDVIKTVVHRIISLLDLKINSFSWGEQTIK